MKALDQLADLVAEDEPPVPVEGTTVRVLDQLADLVAEDERVYSSNVDRRARVRYLWIVVGSRLKNYCQVMAIPRAAGPFGQAIGLRHTLAYARPDQVDDVIVWRTSVHDLTALRETVRETLEALGWV